MKKIILGLGLIITTLFSCSSDDAPSDNDIAKDQIKGVYNLVFESEEGEIEVLDDCRKKTALEITDDVFKQLYFSGSDINCRNSSLITGSYTIQNSSLSAKTNDGDFEIEVTFEEDLLVFTYTTENEGVDVEKWKKTTAAFPTIEEEEEEEISPIVGEWQLISLLIDDIDETEECDEENTIIFKDNSINTVELIFNGNEVTSTVNEDGSVTEEVTKCIPETLNGTFNKTTSTITINNEDSEEFTVSLEDGKLKLSSDGFVYIYEKK